MLKFNSDLLFHRTFPSCFHWPIHLWLAKRVSGMVVSYFTNRCKEAVCFCSRRALALAADCNGSGSQVLPYRGGLQFLPAVHGALPHLPSSDWNFRWFPHCKCTGRFRTIHCVPGKSRTWKRSLLCSTEFRGKETAKKMRRLFSNHRDECVHDVH
jgi:hypothetical protein